MSVYFWKENEAFGEFSNFYPSRLKLDGRLWPTVEHYFQAMKTLDVYEQERIRHACTPMKAKNLGRGVKLRSDWEQVKFEIMLKALRVKFSLEPFRTKLLSTKEEQLFEDSPFDHVWGTGRRGSPGPGKNLLGQALMLVRSELLSEAK